MDEQHKLELIESAKKLTLEGNIITSGLCLDFGGIWQTSWETLERAIQGDGTLTAADIELYNWMWKGKGEQIPDPIKERFPPSIAEHRQQNLLVFDFLRLSFRRPSSMRVEKSGKSRACGS